MIEIKPDKKVPTVFLAGAIDMGTDKDWRKEVIDYLKDMDVIIYNPTINNWNDDWREAVRKQVRWEQEHLRKADVVFFCFPKDSKAPVSLLELGLCLGWNKNVVVFCDYHFYKAVNVVETVCITSKSDCNFNYVFENALSMLKCRIQKLMEK